MPELSQPITFLQLNRDFERVSVPLIQRDYAQGRDSEREVREDFLKALSGALSLPAKASSPLNLDFVYGSSAMGFVQAAESFSTRWFAISLMHRQQRFGLSEPCSRTSLGSSFIGGSIPQYSQCS